MKSSIHSILAFAALWIFLSPAASGWDYEGHCAVNQLALASLPTNFPTFALTPAARERIAFLAGEADRWRNVPEELSFAHASNPDHYFDWDLLADFGLTPQRLPLFRYDFVAQLALARAACPARFARLDQLKDKTHTGELLGLLPWAIVENQGKLKSGFAYLKTYQAYGGTADEIANAQANIVYVMGVMGHYVGDAAQPLHVTRYHHGWTTTNNPNGFTTNYSFHAWIDGGFFHRTGGIHAENLAGKIRSAKILGDPLKSSDLFKQILEYLAGTHQLVEPLYQLEKEQKLSPENPLAGEGRAFLDEQIIRAGQMLGDLWFSAWQQTAEDNYLREQLQQRQPPAKPQ